MKSLESVALSEYVFTPEQICIDTRRFVEALNTDENHFIHSDLYSWSTALHNAGDSEEDMSLRVWRSLIVEFPVGAARFIEYVAQNPFASAEVFWSESIELLSDPAITESFKNYFVSIINTQYWYKPKAMNSALGRMIDFGKPESMFRTGLVLDRLAWFIGAARDGDSFYQQTYEYIVEIIKQKKHESGDINYLLFARIDQVLAGRGIPRTDFSPFVVHGGNYLQVRNNSLYTNDSGSAERVAEVIKQLDTIRQSGNTESVRNSARLVVELKGLLSQPIKPLEVLAAPQESSAVLERDMYDFSYIMRGSIRNRIEQDFGFSCEQLSLPELFQFTRFLKSRSMSDVTTVQAAAQKFGIGFVRTFLSLEHAKDGEGESILSIASMYSREVIERLFNSYSSIVEGSLRLREQLQAVVGTGEYNKMRFVPNQLLDAFLEKSKDLLIALRTSNTVVSPENVLVAMRGLQLLLDILNDFKNRERFGWKYSQGTDVNARYILTDTKSGFEYNLKLFARPIAESRAQARINIELQFDTQNPNVELQSAFTNTVVSHTQSKTTTASVLRFGIDREVGINSSGIVSVDFGRSYREDGELSRTGDVLGNILQTVSVTGRHTQDSLTGWVQDADNFAKVVNLFQSKVIQRDRVVA